MLPCLAPHLHVKSVTYLSPTAPPREYNDALALECVQPVKKLEWVTYRHCGAVEHTIESRGWGYIWDMEHVLAQNVKCG